VEPGAPVGYQNIEPPPVATGLLLLFRRKSEGLVSKIFVKKYFIRARDSNTRNRKEGGDGRASYYPQGREKRVVSRRRRGKLKRSAREQTICSPAPRTAPENRKKGAVLKKEKLIPGAEKTVRSPNDSVQAVGKPYREPL